MYSNKPFPDEWPLKAYDNKDFLHSPEARTIRVTCEFREPEYRFRKYGIKNTIAIFGSARTKSPEVAQNNLDELEKKLAGKTDLSPEETMQLKRAKIDMEHSIYYQASSDLASEMVNWATTLPKSKTLHICSGGGPGIMEAANKGAFEVDPNSSIGLNISLPFEQHSNPYIKDELNLEFHYFFVRKYWFLYPAKALVAFPGGFGTMDELFEMLTLIQTNKAEKKLPIVLFGKEYWENLFNFKALAEWGYIAEEDLDLFVIKDSVEETRDYLISKISMDDLHDSDTCTY